MDQPSLGESYFQDVYAESDDPWHFETSAYEARKYAATLAALDSQTFATALEIGCSIGVLTALLAQRCGRLTSVDINETALARARKRCASLPNVRLARMNVPHEFPTGRFDLIVLSEVGYYWGDDDLRTAIERIAQAAAGGTVELVHYLPKVEDYPRDGDSVHEAFIADRRFTSRRSERRETYRIDVLRVE